MFDDIGEVSFMNNITLGGLKNTALTKYFEESGSSVISDENKAALYAAAQIIYQTAARLDFTAKQNLLKYASGEFLDGLADSVFLLRKKAAAAVVNIRFSLSAPHGTVTAIPAGTRVTDSAGEIFFAVNEYAQIPAGETEIDVLCTAQTGGSAGNDFAVGSLNILADPIPYIKSVSNTEVPEGGSDIETDDELRQRIYLSRYNPSTAGSEGAYIYHCRNYSPLIDDVKVCNPKDAEIVIYILMKDRQDASEAFLSGLLEHMNDENIRPLTDKISVKNIRRVNYNINVSYKIAPEDIGNAEQIQAAVEKSIEEYRQWQSEKIGRDIDPQKLFYMLYSAGARQIEITEPAAAVVGDEEIAVCGGVVINYMGIGGE